MDQSRRGFLTRVFNACAVLAHPLRFLPGSAFERFAQDRGIRPTLARVIGTTLLPGGSSTTMLVGANLYMVDSVLFDSRGISAEIISCAPAHLMLRITTTTEWQPAMSRMHVRLGAQILSIDRAFVADPARQQGPYGRYFYGRYSAIRRDAPGSSVLLEQSARRIYWESRPQEGHDIEYDIPLCIGGHLL